MDTPVWLPTGAGYAVRNHLVDTDLTRLVLKAADTLHIGSQEIIEVALNRNAAVSTQRSSGSVVCCFDSVS